MNIPLFIHVLSTSEVSKKIEQKVITILGRIFPIFWRVTCISHSAQGTVLGCGGLVPPRSGSGFFNSQVRQTSDWNLGGLPGCRAASHRYYMWLFYNSFLITYLDINIFMNTFIVYIYVCVCIWCVCSVYLHVIIYICIHTSLRMWTDIVLYDLVFLWGWNLLTPPARLKPLQQLKVPITKYCIYVLQPKQVSPFTTCVSFASTWRCPSATSVMLTILSF